MTAIVIGLGSMGKRRIRAIRATYPACRILGVEKNEKRCADVSQEYQIKTFSSMDQVTEHVDCAFVCTSPLAHVELISACLERRWHVFTELNLVSDGCETIIRAAEESGCKVFLSSPFFFREEIEYIRSKVDEQSQWNYIYHIGQYLPDWHPWESYESFFVGDKRTNGCREIMAVELPWLIDTFGEIEETHALSDKLTALNIDYHDNFMVQLKHKNGNKGTLVVDIVSPYAIRKLEVYTEGKYMSWDGTPDSLKEYDPETKTLEPVVMREHKEHFAGYSANIFENEYKKEVLAFFDYVYGGKAPLYDMEKDMKTLKLLDSLGV